MTVTVALYFTAAFIHNINGSLEGSQAIIWAAMNVLPPVVGITMLTGISAAGISSASTFLSLIGFSAANDIVPNVSRDDKHKLKLSRMAMLVASLVILVLAYFNPPQIFVIMYLGGTVIASSWSVVAFGSIWSKKLSKTGAYLSMLMGFIGCAGSKVIYALGNITPPVYLDYFFIGIALSVIGAVIGSIVRPVTEEETVNRLKLFDHSIADDDEIECRKDRKMWLVYLCFGIFVGAFFLFMYAIPYTKAIAL
jgi:sodium/pantothenate symporter